MAELVFTEELKGKGAPVEGSENAFTARTTGKNSAGDDVVFESDILMTDDGFTEVGRITYAHRGTLEFDTVGIGHMGPSAIPGVNHGSVIWNITGADGEFAGATGLITANFTFSDEGDVVDNHYVRIFTP